MDNNESKPKERLPTIRFSYKKSKDFRVIKADGAWGGLTPRGDVVMSIFNERLPIPDFDEYEISEDGSLANRVRHHSDTTGIVREVEVVINLSPVVAFTLAKWLMDKVIQFEKTHGIDIRGELDIQETE